MKRTLWILLVTAVLLAACGAKATAPLPAEGMVESVEVAPAEPAMGVPGMQGAGGGVAEENAAYAPQQPAQERLVIQNVDLAIVVADPEARLMAITGMVKEMGGFVVSSNVYQASTEGGALVPEVSVTIRVPAEKLDEALAQIKADTVEVQRESRTGQDVTKEYVDLKSRLRTYEDAEAQLRTILEEKTNPEEVLDVFNQMMYYREQIELIKGQMQYYEEAAALSAVNITIIAEEKVQPLEIGGWRLKGTTRDAVQALINFVQGFLRFLIWLVIVVLPIGAVILVLVWALWRLFRFFWRLLFPRKKTVVPPPPAEQK